MWNEQQPGRYRRSSLQREITAVPKRRFCIGLSMSTVTSWNGYGKSGFSRSHASGEVCARRMMPNDRFSSVSTSMRTFSYITSTPDALPLGYLTAMIQLSTDPCQPGRIRCTERSLRTVRALHGELFEAYCSGGNISVFWLKGVLDNLIGADFVWSCELYLCPRLRGIE
jgi:hypothetical protein